MKEVIKYNQAIYWNSFKSLNFIVVNVVVCLCIQIKVLSFSWFFKNLLIFVVLLFDWNLLIMEKPVLDQESNIQHVYFPHSLPFNKLLYSLEPQFYYLKFGRIISVLITLQKIVYIK